MRQSTYLMDSAEIMLSFEYVLFFHSSNAANAGVFQKPSSTIMPDQAILKITLNPYLFPLAHTVKKRTHHL